MNWPTFFPENCPPNDAKPSIGIFYRVIIDRKGRTIKLKHFISQRQSQPNRTWPPDICECNLCGVSILKELEDSVKLAKILLDTIPAFRQSVGLIASGELNPSMGKLKHTPDVVNNLESHHDWWLPDGCDPSTLFNYCDQVVEKQ